MCRCIRPLRAYCILSPRPIPPRQGSKPGPIRQVERGNPEWVPDTGSPPKDNRQRSGIRAHKLPPILVQRSSLVPLRKIDKPRTITARRRLFKVNKTGTSFHIERSTYRIRQHAPTEAFINSRIPAPSPRRRRQPPKIELRSITTPRVGNFTSAHPGNFELALTMTR